MQTQPLVSVIITTYKRKRIIFNKAITSALKQSYENLEIIIVDDNDEFIFSKELKAFFEELNEKNVSLYSDGINRGAQEARNFGLKVSNGEYIAFLDDDDEWDEKKISFQVEKFIENPKLGIVTCNRYVIKEGSYKLEKVNKKNLTLKKLLEANHIGSTSFPLIKKQCFSKTGLFDTRLEAKQDYDMWLRIMEYYPIGIVEEALARYYSHGDNRISNNYHKKLRAEKFFLDKHYDKLKQNKKALALKYEIIGRYYLLANNDFTNARKNFTKSFFKNPFRFKVSVLLFFAIFKINHYSW